MATDSVHVLRNTELNHVTCHEIHRAKLQGVLDPMQVPEKQNHNNVKRCTSQTQRTLIRRAKLQGVLDPHASTYYWKRKHKAPQSVGPRHLDPNPSTAKPQQREEARGAQAKHIWC